MARSLGERLRLIRLFDTYGPLLTHRQQRLLRLYYHHDLSLGEIAERQAVSRQAVFDALRRSTEELEHLEETLAVVEFRRQLAERVAALTAAVQRLTARVGAEAAAEVTQELEALRRSLR
ncbi:MAG: sigma factor-like helix-turn-helix DNA-binding protein [Armatimonadota bacterium]|nr:sigma factor-like helix-turn-helix DNA-binding protein [Armatimonadota bacterium]MDR7451806.1 sigma factor-like helix-turn-helix DNA-binding protein [Armatimonadota bacterium]MDR7467431.1 sigma factor-like helix-turn-helix DNA-binding protein [Armatimonadota bacterium]MDR7494201.1 sigma factor-like helix-turn-helix DNA-binding protein [Armatimonadota bacterium]MDR7498833.1 sigma factor-like helix-turn-helix DNA-binding protein [Armatimonadota bacterium]